MIEEIEKNLVVNRLYPSEAFLWETGKAVYEHPFIEKTEKENFILHIQRHYLWDPFTRAEFRDWYFESLKDAVKKYTDLKNGIF